MPITAAWLAMVFQRAGTCDDPHMRVREIMRSLREHADPGENLTILWHWQVRIWKMPSLAPMTTGICLSHSLLSFTTKSLASPDKSRKFNNCHRRILLIADLPANLQAHLGITT